MPEAMERSARGSRVANPSGTDVLVECLRGSVAANNPFSFLSTDKVEPCTRWSTRRRWFRSLDFVNIETQEAGVVPFGVSFKNPNFAKVAEARRQGHSRRRSGRRQRSVDHGARAQGCPVVVDAVVDPFALALPSPVPFHTAAGFTLSMAKQVWSGKMDAVIKSIEHNVELV